MSADVAAELAREVASMRRKGTSAERVVTLRGTRIGVLVEELAPPVAVVIFGAGPDVVPLVRLAREMGWRTEVVDPHANPASHLRLRMADRVTLARPDDVGAHVTITPGTMAVVMTHNYSHDRALLGFLLDSPARYIGIMGPGHRTQRMLRELADDRPGDRLGAQSLGRLHAPIGLDIGADGPFEIALAIIAEMRAVASGRQGAMLRTRLGAIHERVELGPQPAADERAASSGAGRRAYAESPAVPT
jgi:xanthine/CO dehydrogenase XdhC/CoxF family maturation factor